MRTISAFARSLLFSLALLLTISAKAATSGQGDIILKKMGQIFEENLYPLDVASRWGGEEFTILLPRTTRENSVRVAEKIRKIIDNYQWQVTKRGNHQ